MRSKREQWLQTCCFTLTDEELGKENRDILVTTSDRLIPLSNEIRKETLAGEEKVSEGYESEEYKTLKADLAIARKKTAQTTWPLWDKEYADWDSDDWRAEGCPEEFIEERESLLTRIGDFYKGNQGNRVTVIDHNYHYTYKNMVKMGCKEAYMDIPVGFWRGAIKNIHGAIDSKRALRMNGDLTAQWLGPQEKGKFYALRCEPGCSIVDGRNLQIGFGDLGTITHEFPGLSNPENRPLRLLLKEDGRIKELNQGRKRDEKVPGPIKSFTLSRRSKRNPDKQEPDLQKPGVWRFSVNYELPLPEKKPETKFNTVYLVIDPQWLGVLAPGKEFFTLKLPQPHAHWYPIVEEIENRLEVIGWKNGRPVYKKNRSYSRKFFGAQKRHSGGRQKCYALTHRQQKQTEYEIIAHGLLELGVHFIVYMRPIRAKAGALADASKTEQGGHHGFNRLVQSTGVNSMVLKQKQKVKGYGGSVRQFDELALPDVSWCYNPEHAKRILALEMQKHHEWGTAKLKKI